MNLSAEFIFLRTKEMFESFPVTDFGPCSYLPGHRESLRACRLIGVPPFAQACATEIGFRRSGDIFYRPECENCDRCISIRVDPNRFHPTKKQRHIRNKNKDIEVSLQPIHFTDEKYILYQRYIKARHPDSPTTDRRDIVEEVFCPHDFTMEVQYRLEGRLIGVTIVDLVSGRILSSVYHFFDPDLSARSIGTFSILAEIQMCVDMNIPWYYLGYWVPECRKMRYKADFRPNQVLIDGEWIDNPFIDG